MPRSADERRAAILESAIRLFGAQGHDATKMSDIVAEVGGSKATLYKYFPSKEALLHAVVETIGTVDFGALDALLDGDAPIADRVRAFARAYLRHLADPKTVHLRRLMAFEVHRSNLARRIYEADVKPAWSQIGESLAREMERGHLRHEDSWVAAMHLKALIEGYLPPLLDLDAIDRPSDAALRKVADAAADIFVRAYAPADAAERPVELAVVAAR